MMYYTGKIEKFWPDDFKSFSYERQPISEEEIDKWTEMGYDYVKSFSGSMYNNANPLPEWVFRFEKLFGLKNQTYNFYKMSTLEIMPEHVDHYRTYMKIFGAEYQDICRVLIMLEDWKPGHYLEINKIGYVNWKAGDYYLWKSDCPHAASNIGVDDRYTLQITGERVK